MNGKIYQAKAMGQMIGLMLYDEHQLSECIQQGNCWFGGYKILPPLVNCFVEVSVCLGPKEKPNCTAANQ